jgi:RNA polymerase sigma-70 factor, ECF subfamily
MTRRHAAREAEASNHTPLARELESLRVQLVRSAAYLTTNRADAEDAVQTALLRAVERGPAHPKLHAWLKTVVRNCAIDLNRQRLRWSSKPIDAAADDLATNAAHETEPDWTALAEIELQTIVDCCTPKLRHVLELRYLNELSYDEIAKVLAIPSKTVATRLHRAHDLVRRQLSARLACTAPTR